MEYSVHRTKIVFVCALSAYTRVSARRITLRKQSCRSDRDDPERNDLVCLRMYVFPVIPRLEKSQTLLLQHPLVFP